MKAIAAKIVITWLLIWFLPMCGYTQTTTTGRVIFYNTENFFDTIKDPVKDDAEFTPQGSSHWTAERYQHKLDNISKVLAAMLDTIQPLFIGLCEMENIQVSEDLAAQPRLKKYNLGAIEFDSPDPRGIDVALLYNKTIFTITSTEYLPVAIPYKDIGTRDILYVKGSIKGKELHIFINHWPSRRDGPLTTRPRRCAAAMVLKNKLNKIVAVDKNARILVLGDFNDNPVDSSLTKVLGAATSVTGLYEQQLCNLMVKPYNDGQFTLKYHFENDVFDQIIVSGNLLHKNAGIYLTGNVGNIYKQKWLLFNHPKYGEIPNRTYTGIRYYGGFSDHLPVFVDLVW